MQIERRTATLTITLLAAALLGGCNMPSTGGPTPLPPAATDTAAPVSSPAASATPEPASTATPPEPSPPTATAAPAAPPIVHLAAGVSFDLTWVSMRSLTEGWAVGGLSGASDHVFRTTDGGQTWRDVTPPQPADVGLPQAASAFFLDAQTGWVLYHPSGNLTGGGMPLAVWRTGDGGASWTAAAPLAVDLSGATQAVPELYFIDPTHGWIMLHLGAAGMNRYPIYLLRSEDGGATWSTQIDPYNAAYLQSCPKTGWTFSGNTGLASIGNCPFDSAAVDWSSDSGLTWTEIRLPFGSGYSNLAGNAGCAAHSPILFSASAWIVAMDCRTFDSPPKNLSFLYRTNDASTTWTISEYPAGALDFIDTNQGWAFGKDIYRTTDGGANWNHISTVTWDGQFSIVDASHIWAIASSGSNYALVESTNGGSSWAILNAQLVP